MTHRQTTLFQSWQNEIWKPTSSNVPKTSHASCTATSEQQTNCDILQLSKPSGSGIDASGFDLDAGKTWIYPTNLPIRSYQFSIVKEALFKNTLVILPTGLGKTFIAAVIMYNIYRWYPNGKIVFMAPTRPLVAQQIEACFKITGISEEDTTQMTGAVTPEERKKIWKKKRIFYLTPQVLANDLARNICPASSIKCVVIDEAHKALGNHSYCQVIRELQSSTSHFRVLALTATPGSDTQAVKQVLTNLLISHVELRTEESDDVTPYIHAKNIVKVTVPLGNNLTSLKDKFLDIINVYLTRLCQRNAMSAKSPASLSQFQMFKIREKFSQCPPNGVDKQKYGFIMADFSICISLYHAYELLLNHGVRSFYNFLTGVMNGDKSIPHTRFELSRNSDFEEMMNFIGENYLVNPLEQSNLNIDSIHGQKNFLPGHPKLEKLEEIVLEHFQKKQNGTLKSTRVMIFSQYRDSVNEIMNLLNKHQPLIKVMSFIGQATKSVSSTGYSQKRQLQVIEDFRKGGYNTLVSTCVGEEGLDIGEVDLIICFDSPKSPIRLVQRMGRTGRQRQGQIIVLVTEGKEEQVYNSCEKQKKAIYRSIKKGISFEQCYYKSPALVPDGLRPVCLKTFIEIKQVKATTKRKGKRKTSAFLNTSELTDFTNNFDVQCPSLPLLPKSEFLTIGPNANKNMHRDVSEKQQESDEVILPLSKWTLWQTTPQHAYMVSHSSRTYVLTETMELIHDPYAKSKPFSHALRPCLLAGFPDVVQHPVDMPDFTSVLNAKNSDAKTKKNVRTHSETVLQGFNYDLEFDDVINAGSSYLGKDAVHLTTDSTKDVGTTKATATSSSLLKTTNLRCDNQLIKNLFNIEFSDLKRGISNVNLMSPPLCANLSRLKSDFSQIHAAKFSPPSKSSFFLRMLNKKLKAKIKRRGKEIESTQPTTAFNATKNKPLPSNYEYSFLSSLPTNENKTLPSEKSVSSVKPLNEVNAQDAVCTSHLTFDLDFDIDPVHFEEEWGNIDSPVSNQTNENRDSTSKRKIDSERQKTDDLSFGKETVASKCKLEERRSFPQTTLNVPNTATESNTDFELLDEDDISFCSDDEVCPTPPRNVPCSVSEFSYTGVNISQSIASQLLSATQLSKIEKEETVSECFPNKNSTSQLLNSTQVNKIDMEETFDDSPSLLQSQSILSDFSIFRKIDKNWGNAGSNSLTQSQSLDKQVKKNSYDKSFSDEPCFDISLDIMQKTQTNDHIVRNQPSKCNQTVSSSSSSSPLVSDIYKNSNRKTKLHDQVDISIFKKPKLTDITSTKRDSYSAYSLQDKQISSNSTCTSVSSDNYTESLKSKGHNEISQQKSLKRNSSKEILSERICGGEGNYFKSTKVAKHHHSSDNLSLKGRKKVNKQKSHKNRFLCTQVEVSGSESSDDEFEDDNEGSSFIDDNPSFVENSTDNYALYLRSLKDHIGMPQKFKLKFTNGRPNDVYSQPPEEKSSAYLLDSFVVNDDHVDFFSSGEDDRSRIYREKVKKNKKKHKRIVTLKSSSSEDEHVPHEILKRNSKTTPVLSHVKGSKCAEKSVITIDSDDGNKGKTNSMTSTNIINDYQPSTSHSNQAKCDNGSVISFDLSKDDDFFVHQDLTFDFAWDMNNISATSNKTNLIPDNGNDTVVPNCTSLETQMNANPSTKSLTILVDSRELAGGKTIISVLRNKYKANPIVMQLSSADYIVSNRIAVERFMDSEFGMGHNNQRVIDKVRTLIQTYEKAYVIIEKDGRKQNLGFNKNVAKYLHFSVSVLQLSSLKLLYSDSSEHSAKLLFELAQKEYEQKQHIDVPIACSTACQQLYEFYLSIPHVNPVCALNFAYKFPVVKHLITSSIREIKDAGHISLRKAEAISRSLKNDDIL